MATDFTGIENCNEYFTNHYFVSLLSEKITTYSKQLPFGEEGKTIWSNLRDVGKEYSQIHDRSQRGKSFQLEYIPQIADRISEVLGYGLPEPSWIDACDTTMRTYGCIKDGSGRPSLYLILSHTGDEENVLSGAPFFSGNDGTDIYKTDCSALVDDLFFKNLEPPRWIMIVGVDEIALLDRTRWGERRYLKFNLEDIFGRHEESTLKAMSVLLHRKSLFVDEGQSTMDSLLEDSSRNATGVSTDLKKALRESIEILGNEVIYDQIHRLKRDVEEDPIDPDELSIQCLRYMYRMLFMLFIESRPELGYAPMGNQPYLKGYSLESLRDVADMVRADADGIGDGYFMHETLSKLYRMIYEGYPSDVEVMRRVRESESIKDVFVVEPLKAHIFDPEYTKIISESKLRDSAMLKIVDLMSVTCPDKKNIRRGRISYSALGINQMGAIYEALLSYRGFIAEERLYEVKAEDDDKFDELSVGYFVKESELDEYTEKERVRHKDGKLRCYEKGSFVYRLAGREREKSASFYTPESLTKTLVKYTLKEVIDGKSADDILDMKICEPAMGSAAFLNETVNQLAEIYLEKKQNELGRTIPYSDYRKELQRVKMYIADKNVYGVDLNPTAVELAEVSLWLNTIFEGGYVPWFKMQLVNGNSLVGARRQCYKVDELRTDKSPVAWFTHKPKRIMPGQDRMKDKQVYHFLTGDPGMADYKDKVVKSLFPENFKKIADWRKQFNKPFSESEIETVIRLSGIIDHLWAQQVQLRHKVDEETSDPLSVWGHEDTSRTAHTTIREKDEIFSKEYLSEKMANAGPYARLKFAMDYWCSLWFWPIDKADLLPTREQFLYDMSMILIGDIKAVEGRDIKFDKDGKMSYQTTLMPSKTTESAQAIIDQYGELGQVDLPALCRAESRLAISKNIADQFKFMHWELEFADLFQEHGGFDVVVGNPPWIKLEWAEEDVLSDYNPMLRVRKIGAAWAAKLRNNLLEDEDIRFAYHSEYSSITGMQNYLNAVHNYEELKGVQTNLFKCFIPQSLMIARTDGMFSFVHPNGIFDDPNGTTLREIIYPKLRKHFRFINEKYLFPDIGHPISFSLNVYQNSISKVTSFDMICNLFDPSTIEECYSPTGSKLMGLKDDAGNWNVTGHPDRVVHITDSDLKTFAKLFGEEKWKGAHILSIHSKQILGAIEQFTKTPGRLSKDTVFMNVMLDETNSQKAGIITRYTDFPESISEVVLSGPNITVSNPLYKTARAKSVEKSDYDNLDLEILPGNYIPRCNYKISIPEKDIREKWTNQNGRHYTDSYRILSRKMLGLALERTLHCAIVPPGIAHTNGLIGFMFDDDSLVPTIQGTWSSLPYDFLIKVIGKTNLNMDNVSSLPLFDDSPLLEEIQYRALKLNCLTKYYSDLVRKVHFSINPEWSKDDPRLPRDFSRITYDWTEQYPLRTDYSRRQALVEIDVLVSLLLGLKLDQLCTIYEIQFPVMNNYESDTWYDKNGRIVFTSSKGLLTTGVDRKIWEEQKNNISISKIIAEDYLPSGPTTRVVVYEAPFERCDRKKDYEVAWKFFTAKYRGKI